MRIETPEDFSEAQRIITKKIGCFLRVAESKYGRGFPFPTVKYDIKGRVGGSANADKNLIRLNPVLMRENFIHYSIQTIGHEVAHLIQRWVYGNKCDPHGIQWKEVMVNFGLPPKRCHSYDTSNVPTQIRKQVARPTIQRVNGGNMIVSGRGGVNVQVTNWD